MLKKKVVHRINTHGIPIVKFQAISYVAHILYITGLTSLIPIVPLVFQNLSFVNYAFWFAIGLVVLSFLVVFLFTKSKKQAFKTLGLMTLIPGLLAVFFAYIGIRRMALLIGYFRELSPFVQSWINNYVPNTWMLSGIYIIVGVGLIWISQLLRR